MSVADTRTPVTVITGASNGIGRAIAEAVLAQGRAVVNLDYVLPTWSHPLLTSYQGDLTDEASTRERAAEMAAQHNVTALVNNAGATRPGTIDTATTQQLDDVVGLHLRAPMLLVQAFLPTLRACGQGRIVNMSSRAALGKGERIVYSATKAGMIGMTRTLAMELGATASPSTPSALAPSPPSCSARATPKARRRPSASSRALPWAAWERPKTWRARQCSSSRPTTASSPARCCTSAGAPRWAWRQCEVIPP